MIAIKLTIIIITYLIEVSMILTISILLDKNEKLKNKNKYYKKFVKGLLKESEKQ